MSILEDLAGQAYNVKVDDRLLLYATARSEHPLEDHKFTFIDLLIKDLKASY
jgi:hypothetical protein